jgi:hypothetical protein
MSTRAGDARPTRIPDPYVAAVSLAPALLIALRLIQEGAQLGRLKLRQSDVPPYEGLRPVVVVWVRFGFEDLIGGRKEQRPGELCGDAEQARSSDLDRSSTLKVRFAEHPDLIRGVPSLNRDIAELETGIVHPTIVIVIMKQLVDRRGVEPLTSAVQRRRLLC